MSKICGLDQELGKFVKNSLTIVDRTSVAQPNILNEWLWERETWAALEERPDTMYSFE